MTADVLFGLIYLLIGLGTALLARHKRVSPGDAEWHEFRIGGGPSWGVAWLFRLLGWPFFWLFIAGMWALWLLSQEF